MLRMCAHAVELPNGIMTQADSIVSQGTIVCMPLMQVSGYLGERCDWHYLQDSAV